MTLQQIIDTLRALEPALAGVVAAFDPRDAATVAALEALLPALTQLVVRYDQIRAASNGVSPELWAQIVADKQAADAAVAAAAPKG
ncbi:MAG: hypothetical protein JSR26_03975 [Proteobacteria bacterium]|nr:hypothetical protein [Pseudomonadota bacterium]